MPVKHGYKIDPQAIQNMPLAITISMTVAEWGRLRAQMQTNWPSSDVARAIYDALEKIDGFAAHQVVRMDAEP